jgi:hypothetical protein
MRTEDESRFGVDPSPTTIDAEAPSVQCQPSPESSAEQLNPSHGTQVPSTQRTHHEDHVLKPVQSIEDFCIAELPTGETVVDPEATSDPPLPVERARADSQELSISGSHERIIEMEDELAVPSRLDSGSQGKR